MTATAAQRSAEAAAASQKGDHAVAIGLLAEAVSGEPGNWALQSNLGLALARGGRPGEAIDAYRAALALAPGHGPTLGKLGRALSEAGRQKEALEALQQAVELAPADAAAANALGAALANGGERERARKAFTRAVALDPGFEEAWVNLGQLEAARLRWTEAAAAFAHTGRHYETGVALGKLARHEQALAAYERAVAAWPNDARAWNNLGHTLAALGRHAAAEKALLRALSMEPHYVDARYNLGVTLQSLGRDREARTAYQLVIAAAGAHADALNNLGGLCLSEARPERAAPLYASALGANPLHPEARWNLGLAQLGSGDMENGWRNYEHRKRARQFDGGVPGWAGDTPLSGRTVLVWCEQGLGDAIQFLRYVPVLEARGARVVVECPARLGPLLGWAVKEVVERGAALPPFDVHVSAMSLPALLGTRLDSVPAPGPVYAIPPVARRRWRQRLDALGKRLCAGIVWGGNPENTKGLARSMPLEALVGAFAGRPDVALVSLQHGPQSGDAAAFPEIAVWEQADLCDTAALVAELDMVITIDTLMAHLAGTLGRQTAVLLPFAADWRWMTGRADSPWYPNMRLYRQQAPGDWDSAAKALAVELDGPGLPAHRNFPLQDPGDCFPE